MVLDLLWEHVLSTLSDDDVLGSSCKVYEAAVITIANVTCSEPSVLVNYLSRSLRVLVIALHDVDATHAYLSVAVLVLVPELDLHVWKTFSNGSLFVVEYWVERYDGACLGKAISLHEVYPKLVELFEGRCWKRSTTGDAYSVLVKRHFLEQETEHLLSNVYLEHLLEESGEAHHCMDESVDERPLLLHALHHG